MKRSWGFMLALLMVAMLGVASHGNGYSTPPPATGVTSTTTPTADEGMTETTETGVDTTGTMETGTTTTTTDTTGTMGTPGTTTYESTTTSTTMQPVTTTTTTPGTFSQLCPDAPPGSVAVDGDYVYVVRGDELLKFDKDTLRFVSSTMVPMAPATTTTTSTTTTYRPLTTTTTSVRDSVIMEPGMRPGMYRADVRERIYNLEALPTREFDPAFLNEMARHHSVMITMSNIAEDKAQQPELRQWASQFADEESRSSTQIGRWLDTWYGGSSTAGLGGGRADVQVGFGATTPSEAGAIRTNLLPTDSDERDIDRLKQLSGRDFDIAYLSTMITHLSEATEMARIASERADRRWLREEATDMTAHHAGQAGQLRGWLSTWYNMSP